MSSKYFGFLAGVTVTFNVIVASLLFFDLGLPSGVVRWTAFGIVVLDAIVEVVVFIAKKEK